MLVLVGGSKCCRKARKDRGGVHRRRVKNVGSLQIREQGKLKGFHIIKKKSELLHEQYVGGMQE